MSKRPIWIFRRLIVDPKAQFAMLAYSCMLLIAGITLTVAAERVLQESAEGLDAPILALALSGIALFGLIVAAQLELTNRVFGPLHRMKKHMNDIGEGAPPTSFQSRRGDFLDELAESYNRALSRLINKP